MRPLSLLVVGCALSVACSSAAPSQSPARTTPPPAQASPPSQAAPPAQAPRAPAGETAPPRISPARFSLRSSATPAPGNRAAYEWPALPIRARGVSVRVRAHGRRQHVRRRRPKWITSGEVREALQAAPRRRSFYASLGNHDDPNQRFYKLFNMNGGALLHVQAAGRRALLRPRQQLHGREQIAWLEKELSGSELGLEDRFFHHPLYSSAARRADLHLRRYLSPCSSSTACQRRLRRPRHFYERIKPQKGINTSSTAASAKLRPEATSHEVRT